MRTYTRQVKVDGQSIGMVKIEGPETSEELQGLFPDGGDVDLGVDYLLTKASNKLRQNWKAENDVTEVAKRQLAALKRTDPEAAKVAAQKIAEIFG